MNERFKQLALEAFQPINDIASEGIADRYTFDQAWFQMYNQKFAELIVRECADICYHHSNAAGGVDTHFGYGYKDCGDDIKRNFGVKK